MLSHMCFLVLGHLTNQSHIGCVRELCAESHLDCLQHTEQRQLNVPPDACPEVQAHAQHNVVTQGQPEHLYTMLQGRLAQW